MIEISLGSARLQLWPQRAAYLPEHQALLVADAHLGKAQSFQRLGVPVPSSATAGTLQRLTGAVAATGARQVVFLGDLLHAARGRTPDVLAAVAAWREQHAALTLTLVRGNHDGHAGDPPADWRVGCVDEPLMLGGLALCHHPQPRQGAYVLAGHLHPGAVIHGRAHDSLRLPCFHFGPAVGVLPAFGEFTGLKVLPRGPQDRVFMTTGETVHAL